MMHQLQNKNPCKYAFIVYEYPIINVNLVQDYIYNEAEIWNSFQMLVYPDTDFL